MNLQQSLRIIFRNKTFSFVNIAGLAIGITSAALILLWVEYQVNDNRSVPNINRLYEVGQHQRYGDDFRTFFVAPGPLSEFLNNGFTGVRTSTRYTDTGITFEIDDQVFYENGAYADSTLFGMIDMSFVSGNPKTAFEPANPVLLSRKSAEKIFGNIDVLGKTLKTDGNLYEVTGVFEDRELNGTFRFEWLIPFRIYENELVTKGWVSKDNWSSNWMKCYAEIEPGADVQDINRRLTEIHGERSSWGKGTKTFIFPVKDQRLYGEHIDGTFTGSGYIRTVRMFFWIGMIILLIACINFMNLSTARSEKRALEVGVRKTFGAKHMGLIRRFMGESALITCISILLSVMLILLFLPSFNTLINLQLKIDFTNPYHLFGLLAVGVLCILLAGAYPALYLSSFSPIQTLKRMNQNIAGGAIWIRKGLVVFQFAVSFILICATMVIFLQLRHVYNRPLGIDVNNLVYFSSSDEIKRNFAAVRQELINTGFVSEAGLSSQRLIQLGSNGGGYTWQGKDENINPFVQDVRVSPGLFAAAGMRLSEGNDFSFQNFGEKHEVVINRSFTEMMGEEGRVGGFLSRGGDPIQIIGIVEDFIFNNLSHSKVEPVIFYPQTETAEILFIRFSQGKSGNEAIATIQKTLKIFSPETTFEPTYMDSTFDNMFYNYRFTGKLAMLFAVLAIFLSCLGLFGLVAYSAEQRTREIGIRKILGASVWEIVQLLTSSFMKLILIAFTIALPVSWYVSNSWLQSYSYKISLGWYIFAATGVLVIIIALLTVGFQAIKAATANPVNAIKSN